MKKNTEKYAVIGGQYQSYFYGFASTLHSAKCLASKHVEYWDNWQGFHTPSIYRAEDVVPCANFYGDGYTPKDGASPVAIRYSLDDRWSVLQ